MFIGNNVGIAADLAVGKTSIIDALMGLPFSPLYQPTINLDFRVFRNQQCFLRFWEIGHSTFRRCLFSSTLKDLRAAMIVYDVTLRETFKYIDTMIQDAIYELGGATQVILVGTKVDKELERCVSTEEGQRKADSYGVLFLEVSAKTNKGIAALASFFERFAFNSAIDFIFVGHKRIYTSLIDYFCANYGYPVILRPDGTRLIIKEKTLARLSTRRDRIAKKSIMMVSFLICERKSFEEAWNSLKDEAGRGQPLAFIGFNYSSKERVTGFEEAAEVAANYHALYVELNLECAFSAKNIFDALMAFCESAQEKNPVAQSDRK